MDIFDAAETGQNAAIVELLKMDPFCKDYQGFFNRTPLILGCISGHVATVRLLLENNVNQSLSDNLGMTARDWAIHNQN